MTRGPPETLTPRFVIKPDGAIDPQGRGESNLQPLQVDTKNPRRPPFPRAAPRSPTQT